MSLKLVESEVRRFLSTKEPEVICLSGRWGVGKTFAWKRYLKDAQAAQTIGLKRYSYVSLFGVNSLDELKYSIFENSVDSTEIGIEPNLETLRSNTTAAAKRLGKKSVWFLEQLPIIKQYVGGLGPAWFLLVRNTIVCLDDIERHGKNLNVRDVLGLVSNLKEQRGCKTCLILNDEAMEEIREFRTYFEKVVDTALKFEPSAAESADIALQGATESLKILAGSCVALGISNIRLIKRIERLVQAIEPILKEFDEVVLKQTVQSLALLTWSMYEPNTAPSLDYLQKIRGADPFGIDKKKDVPPKEAAWNALLDSYGFSHMDELDLVLLDGVQKVFFDPSLVQKHARELDQQVKVSKLDNSFTEAWRKYHDSFDDNQEDVLDAMYQSFFRGVRYITPLNMSSTVGLFKVLGRSDQAAQMLKHYVESRADEHELFNIRNYPFAGDITDPDVISAFNEKYDSFKKDQTDPRAILFSIADTNSWNPEDITLLAAVPVDTYRRMLKGSKGHDLRKIIKACLQFDSIMNATPEMKEISKRTKNALQLIGQESAINARRVKVYGVIVDSNASPDSAIRGNE